MNYLNDENDDLQLGGGVGSDWDCNHAGDGSHTCSDTPVATGLVTVIKMTEGNHFFKGQSVSTCNSLCRQDKMFQIRLMNVEWILRTFFSKRDVIDLYC